MPNLFIFSKRCVNALSQFFNTKRALSKVSSLNSKLKAQVTKFGDEIAYIYHYISKRTGQQRVKNLTFGLWS